MIDLEGFLTESPDAIFGVNYKLARLKSGELVWMRVSPNTFTYIIEGDLWNEDEQKIGGIAAE